jgi:hypothetical protein
MGFYCFFFSPGSDIGNVAVSANDLLGRFPRIPGIGGQVGLDLSLNRFDGINRDHAGIQNGFKLAS